MGYGLLGPVEVRADDRAVELTSASQRLVLAMLLLEANRLVPAHRLIDELWGEALPADPPAALRTQVSRLRRALGPAGGSLVTADGGYRLSLQRRQLDTARFEDALAAASQTAGKQGLAILDEALGLWRGPALAGFAGRPFARAEAVRLEELRVTARERRAELVLSLERAEDAVADLQAIVAEHPERERARPGWTACRSPSSSQRPGCRVRQSASWPAASRTASACLPRGAAPTAATGLCEPSSAGPTSC